MRACHHPRPEVPSLLVPLILSLALLVLSGGPLPGAQAFEVVVQGRVLDQDGEPLDGVRITVTREGSDRQLQEETDRKGRYRIFLLHGNLSHVFRLERDGYEGAEHDVRPIETRSHDERDRPARRPEGGVLELDFTLRSEESLTRQAAEVPEDASPAARRRAATTIYNEGVEAAQKTLWSRAEERFRAALAIDPEMGPARAALAKVLFEQGRCQESLEEGETARELEPADPELWQIRYECVRRTGTAGEVARALDELAERAPRLAVPGLMARARMRYDAHDDPDAALQSVERVLEADPAHARAHHLKGLVLLELRRTEAAREALERYLELAPDAWDAADVRALLEDLEREGSSGEGG
ncbi:MAG: tetratricopeptide repeat protein [Thermoanaerobaculia bacterium]